MDGWLAGDLLFYLRIVEVMLAHYAGILEMDIEKKKFPYSTYT